MPTKSEIMSELEALGIPFNKRATKAELQFMLDSVILTVTTTPNLLNVREGAGFEYDVLEVVPRGTELEVIGTDGDWLVTDRGFVLAKYTE